MQPSLEEIKAKYPLAVEALKKLEHGILKWEIKYPSQSIRQTNS